MASALRGGRAVVVFFHSSQCSLCRSLHAPLRHLAQTQAWLHVAWADTDAPEWLPEVCALVGSDKDRQGRVAYLFLGFGLPRRGLSERSGKQKSEATPMPHRPREDERGHPVDTSRANLASALGLFPRRHSAFLTLTRTSSQMVHHRVEEAPSFVALLPRRGDVLAQVRILIHPLRPKLAQDAHRVLAVPVIPPARCGASLLSCLVAHSKGAPVLADGPREEPSARAGERAAPGGSAPHARPTSRLKHSRNGERRYRCHATHH
jgi:hypothetical protein